MSTADKSISAMAEHMCQHEMCDIGTFPEPSPAKEGLTFGALFHHEDRGIVETIATHDCRGLSELSGTGQLGRIRQDVQSILDSGDSRNQPGGSVEPRRPDHHEFGFI